MPVARLDLARYAATGPLVAPLAASRSASLLTLLVLATTTWPGASAADPLDPTGFAALGSLNLAAGSYVIDTGGALPTLRGAANQVLFTGVLFDQGTAFNPSVAVFDFSAIGIAAGATLTATGDRPLALLSRGSFSFAGALDAAGRNGGDQGAGVGGAGGPGAGAGGAGSTGGGQAQAGFGPGGGSGGYDGLGNGSWGDGGAYGGRGSGLNPFLTPAAAYGNLPHQLLAGSGGGGTGRNLFGSGAGGGGGGGAVEFGALASLTLAGGAAVLATGGQGGGGNAVIAGGGAGGGLLLHAPDITFESSMLGPAELRADGDSGGRIAFITGNGTVTGNLANVTVAPSAGGEVGVITFNALPAVPEPSSWALLLGGGAVLAALRRRRRS